MDDNSFDNSNDAPRPYKPAIVAELMELDRELMKLLGRRTKLLGKLRGGKGYAASPAAAGAEKEVRTAWEKNALAFSRDDKFSRQLFSLLQEIQMDSRAVAESRSAYNLSPSRKPVEVAVPGPQSVTGGQMLAFLAAALESDTVFEGILLTDPLMDSVKALNNAGAGFSWSAGSRVGEGMVQHIPGVKSLRMATDKALYIGEEPFTMYLMAFLAAGQTGKSRFTGGSGLKMADLSPLRRFLPELGARMAHSVPKSNGLPCSVEASGILPEAISVPSDFPREGLMALLCIAASWRKVITIDCGALPMPLFTAALAECLPVLRRCSVTDSLQGAIITLDGTAASMPERPICPLDPVLSAYLLALPLFAGGNVSLLGEWDATLPCAQECVALLGSEGLEVIINTEGIATAVAEKLFSSSATEARNYSDLDARLVPLALACRSREVWRTKGAVPLPSLPEDTDNSTVESFFAHVCIDVRDGKLYPGTRDRENTPWTSPSPVWSFAYALCAYDCSNIGLTNHMAVSSVMPSFWALYNALPNPSEEKKAPEKQEKIRRRIISRSDAE